METLHPVAGHRIKDWQPADFQIGIPCAGNILKKGDEDMCKYCERRTDVKFGWNQPKLPYHNPMDPSGNLSGNIADFSQFEGAIHDYQTATPQLILTSKGYFEGIGVGTVYIPIKYCPECGRKLGKPDNQSEKESVESKTAEMTNLEKLQTGTEDEILKLCISLAYRSNGYISMDRQVEEWLRDKVNMDCHGEIVIG